MVSDVIFAVASTLLYLTVASSQEYADDYWGNGRSGRQNQDSGFFITSSGRRGSESRFSVNGGRRSPSKERLTIDGDRGGSFPDYFRVEVEIQELDNPSGVLSTGQHCDTMNDCDVRVQAYLDVSNPRTPWPGTYSPSRWAIIYEGTNNNSPQFNRVITRDICGGSLSTVNARVQALDADDLSGHDEIGQFECLFDVNPRDITAPNMARWSSSKQCSNVRQQGQARLLARIRVYEIPSSSCRASRS
ncbi:hypothetical protein RvY_19200 [Ramazzottius varieornatus]|uniref:CUB domain-containing protein n=1 Tax=Ramazzottius varieornatus TaxID=947166 RepID=A0A1D1W8M0_RAMVA|nr:hypothetical protein RvY_19200 [Ramazzottius varieornatus]